MKNSNEEIESGLVAVNSSFRMYGSDGLDGKGFSSEERAEIKLVSDVFTDQVNKSGIFGDKTYDMTSQIMLLRNAEAKYDMWAKDSGGYPNFPNNHDGANTYKQWPTLGLVAFIAAGVARHSPADQVEGYREIVVKALTRLNEHQPEEATDLASRFLADKNMNCVAAELYLKFVTGLKPEVAASSLWNVSAQAASDIGLNRPVAPGFLEKLRSIQEQPGFEPPDHRHPAERLLKHEVKSPTHSTSATTTPTEGLNKPTEPSVFRTIKGFISSFTS